MEESNAIETFLRTEIRRLDEGARLPGVRTLQTQFRASPLTIQRTVARLVAEGLVVTRPGDGSFVARPTTHRATTHHATTHHATTHRSNPSGNQSGDLAASFEHHVGSDGATDERFDHTWQAAVLGRAPIVPRGLDHLVTAERPGVLALDGGFPDRSLQAHHLLTRAAVRAAKRSESWERCLPGGLEPLRRYFANELGAGFDADDIVITPGVQSAIDSIFRSFSRIGDAVIIEEPSYPGAIAAASFAGLRAIPVPSDRDGMRTDLFADAVARSGARLAFVQPRHSNPSGSVLLPERRRELLDTAHRFGMFIVEDDWVRDLDLDTDAAGQTRATPPPLATDDPFGHVLYLRSVSKVTAPGMRIGAIAARGPAAARLRAVRLISDFFASPHLQATLIELFEDRAWKRHLEFLRTSLRTRRAALIDALSAEAPALELAPSHGGVALWARLPDLVDEAAFVSQCRARGVVVGAGRNYWLSEPPSGQARISFAAAPADALGEAASRIGAALSALAS
jgi:DNA-binding transcriptional MocR family regulator